MKKFCAFFGSLMLALNLVVSPVFAAGGKNQGEIGAGSVDQGEVGKGSSPSLSARFFPQKK